MNRSRIYLVWQHPLLRDSAVAILRQVGLELAGESRGLPEFSGSDPLPFDVILVEEQAGITGQLLALMPQLGCRRLVSVNMADNQLHIYFHEFQTLNQADDLVAALDC